MIIDEKRWYSVSEAVQFLGIKEAAIKNRCRDGKINAQKKGSRLIWHIRGEEIKRLREEWNLED